jgi:hypothetical protein
MFKWLKSLKGLKREDSYVAYVLRRVPNGRYTKFGLNRLRGQGVNLEHTDTHTHTFAFIYKIVLLHRSCNLCNLKDHYERYIAFRQDPSLHVIASKKIIYFRDVKRSVELFHPSL